jgi:hypothetical protein
MLLLEERDIVVELLLRIRRTARAKRGHIDRDLRLGARIGQ